MTEFISHNWISLLSLAVSLIALAINIWLNHMAIQPTFSWIKSENDNSTKLVIAITNLSPRTSLITNIALTSNKRLVKDNGYDFDVAEENKAAASAEKKLQDHKNKVTKLTKEHEEQLKSSPLKDGGLFAQMEPPLVWQENNRYMMEQMNTAIAYKPIRSILNQHVSSNFENPTPLFGNNTVKFSYWLSPEDIPDKVSITLSRTLPMMYKTKSFQLPCVSNNQN